MEKLLNKIETVICTIIEFLVGIIVVFMVGINILQVVTRYFVDQIITIVDCMSDCGSGSGH